MSYDQLVKKYERKQLYVLIFLIIFEFFPFIFIVPLFTGAFLHDGFDIGLLVPVIFLAIWTIITVIAMLLVIRSKNRVRRNIDAMVKQLGITDCESFAAAVIDSTKLKGTSDVFLSSEYLIDLERFWAARIDQITDIYTDEARTDDDVTYYVRVSHDGKKSAFTTTSTGQKKAYQALYDAWQDAGALQKNK